MNFSKALGALTIGVLLSPGLSAKDVVVKDKGAFDAALKRLAPGDAIVLKNGTWQDFEVGFFAEGRAGKPITLRAETPGKVILSGRSNLRLAGQHLVVSGLVFRNGYTPTQEVISFQRNAKQVANHSRVTEVVIDNFNNPDRDAVDYWVSLSGKHNRFDHSYLAGKRNQGVTMAVRLEGEDSQQNHHRIDHNYFGPRPILGSNGGETLRVGTSTYSLTDSHTLIEENYFDRCDGEVEIISIKSGRNIIRNNVFFESRGTLTLRHGNGNLVEGNVFFGNGVENTGGIRVINRDQTVRNNYLEGLTGTRFGSGFAIMNGTVDAPLNRYSQVLNAHIHNNSFIDVDHLQFGAGKDAERNAPPANSRMEDNLVLHRTGKANVVFYDDMRGIRFAGNVVQGVDAELPAGFERAAPALKRNSAGLLMPQDEALRQRGASASLRPIAKAQTGPAWYPKREPQVAFDSGRQIAVDGAREDALAHALAQAGNGDRLVLAPGRYPVARLLVIDKVLSIEAQQAGSVVLLPERNTLFEIRNGGSLKLAGLQIDGSASPDSAGNILIRTQKSGMQVSYRLVLENVEVRNLDVNHSHHLFDAGDRSLAEEIRITGSRFSKISGDLLRLDKERDDLGNYNAEALALDANRFTQIEGALVSLYRGGTDESTFGPRLAFTRNVVDRVGQGKRNKRAAALYLHGVQRTRIAANEFADSAGIVVEHTVGDPDTELRGNTYRKVAALKASELHAKGASTVRVLDNQEARRN
ncbi:right-handed parallel beta-helix repeat-containing protein [Massilia sp. IC2-477]|uniref:chondroitinase-B domain-containing protein n=1 Tax=Massilia sp. IC2-477 TaxID=2887198 RepID=UPI001D11BE0D|nr:chondroitinase-B domain-containing protein [Massilia sp. IC2-477]MCC2956758.1 right-handed parallel beta-helix repeat-containing protein [Massilia sp. IC2-477]